MINVDTLRMEDLIDIAFEVNASDVFVKAGSQP